MSLVENITLPENVEVVNVSEGKLEAIVKGKNVRIVVEDPKYITVSGVPVNEDVQLILDELLDDERIDNYYFEGDSLTIEVWVPEEPVLEDDWPYYEQYLKEAEETLKHIIDNIF